MAGGVRAEPDAMGQDPSSRERDRLDVDREETIVVSHDDDVSDRCHTTGAHVELATVAEVNLSTLIGRLKEVAAKKV